MIGAAWWLVHASMVAAASLILLTLFQNRDLPARLHATGRRPSQVLARALGLWSPLAVAVLLFVLMAQGLGIAAREFVYRVTPLDAWCSIDGAAPAFALPCTGLGREQDRTGLRLVPQSERVRRHVLDRYLRAIDAVRRRPMSDFEPAQAALRLREASPEAVLSLPSPPEADPELLRMRRELREVLATRVAPARNVMDVLRARSDAELRTRRLRELTAQVVARREALAQRAYGGLPKAGQARRWWQHWIAGQLESGARPAAAAIRQVEGVADPALRPRVLRAALLSGLAQDAAWAVERLAAPTLDRRLRGGISLALDLPRLCRFGEATTQVFDCPGRLPAGATLRLRRLSTSDSVMRSITRWHDDGLRDGMLQLGRTGLAARRGVMRARDARLALDRELAARLSLGREACAFTRPQGCAANAVRASLESALGASFGDPLARSRLRMAGWEDAMAASLDARLAGALESLQVESSGLRDRARTLAPTVLLLHGRLLLAGWLLVAFLALKSFLYVLGLEAFRHRGPATLGFDDVPAIAGEWRIGRRLTLDPAFEGPLTTRRQLSNSDNRLRLAPWPGSAPILRLLRGRYFFYTRGRFLGGDDGPGAAQARVASADAGRAIVEWRLQPGEQVVFGWKDFFGASDNLRFRTRLSLRLSTLLLGRIVFRVAHAPADAEGRLLLKADVEQMDPADLQALPPERLLAWNPQVRFRAHGADTAWGVLVHGYTLVREPSVPGLVLTRSDDGGPRFGSLRFLRRLFTAVF